jgi:uncharacterized membrane protein YsdA (DUF1294 family)
MMWLTSMNLVSFLAFGLDKWKATRRRGRMPEASLIWLGLLGGWPGGWLGMTVFRHKSAKRAFQFKYALAAIPFAAEIWAWLHWR